MATGRNGLNGGAVIRVVDWENQCDNDGVQIHAQVLAAHPALVNMSSSKNVTISPVLVCL